jgi:RNA polymerase sigma-70 factor (ECF subfamily)
LSLRPARHLRRVASLPGDFDTFYRAYQPRLLGYARVCFRPGDAEDVVQETLARACANFDRLDPARDPWPWLVVVARNVAHDLVRAGKRCLPVDMADYGQGLPGRERQPEDEALADEEARLLTEALSRVRPADRRVLALRVLDGMSVAEVADLLELTENAVRQRCFRAKNQLAIHYAAACRGVRGLVPLPFLVAYRALRKEMRNAAVSGASVAATGAVAALGLGVLVTIAPSEGAAKPNRLPQVASVRDVVGTGQTMHPAEGAVVGHQSASVRTVSSAPTSSGPDSGVLPASPTQLPVAPRESHSVSDKPLAPGQVIRVDVRITTSVTTVVIGQDSSNGNSHGPICESSVHPCE